MRELNQDTAGVLGRVKRGEHLDITERGTVIARLIPAHTHPLAELFHAGSLRAAVISGPAPRPTGAVRTDRQAGDLLRGMRDEERY